jgi:hypothetical protein
MLKTIIFVLGITCLLFAQESNPVDIWEPFRYFEGAWTGEETGKSGVGQGERSIEFIMNEKYLFYKNVSRFEPQEKNPKGETHEDWTFFSYDKIRQTYIMREFHSEGFVNQYVLDSLSENSKSFIFNSEQLENAPHGLRARVSFTILDENKFREIFELAFPGKDFSIWLENIWRRKIN